MPMDTVMDITEATIMDTIMAIAPVMPAGATIPEMHTGEIIATTGVDPIQVATPGAPELLPEMSTDPIVGGDRREAEPVTTK